MDYVIICVMQKMPVLSSVFIKLHSYRLIFKTQAPHQPLQFPLLESLLHSTLFFLSWSVAGNGIRDGKRQHAALRGRSPERRRADGELLSEPRPFRVLENSLSLPLVFSLPLPLSHSSFSHPQTSAKVCTGQMVGSLKANSLRKEIVCLGDRYALVKKEPGRCCTSVNSPLKLEHTSVKGCNKTRKGSEEA